MPIDLEINTTIVLKCSKCGEPLEIEGKPKFGFNGNYSYTEIAVIPCKCQIE